MEFARTWAGASARRSWTANRSIIGWTSKQPVTYFRDIIPYIYIYIYIYNWMQNVDREESLGYSMNAWAPRPSANLSSCCLGLRRHARKGKQLSVKSNDLSFKIVTVVISTYVCVYRAKGILCGYAIRSGRHPSVSPRPGPTADGRWLPSGCPP